MSQVRKQKIAFYRKLYLAYLIDTDNYSVPGLEAKTGMPRRTIQDCLKALPDVGIQCSFVPKVGGRNNEGHYQITEWGPVRKSWIAENISQIVAVL